MNNLITNWKVIVFIALIGGFGLFFTSCMRPYHNRAELKRIDLLTCEGRIMGTYYYYDRDQKITDPHTAGRLEIIDYKGRLIQYSGDYLVTPVPDTLSN